MLACLSSLFLLSFLLSFFLSFFRTNEGGGGGGGGNTPKVAGCLSSFPLQSVPACVYSPLMQGYYGTTRTVLCRFRLYWTLLGERVLPTVCTYVSLSLSLWAFFRSFFRFGLSFPSLTPRVLVFFPSFQRLPESQAARQNRGTVCTVEPILSSTVLEFLPSVVLCTFYLHFGAQPGCLAAWGGRSHPIPPSFISTSAMTSGSRPVGR